MKKKQPAKPKQFNISVPDECKGQLLRIAAQITLDTGKRTTVSDVVRLAINQYVKGK